MTDHANPTRPRSGGSDSALVGVVVGSNCVHADAVSFYWPSFSWYWFDTGALVREA